VVTRSECPPPAIKANPSGLGAVWGRLRTRGQRRALALSTGLHSVVNLTRSTSSPGHKRGYSGAAHEKIVTHCIRRRATSIGIRTVAEGRGALKD
jgi:hypothetical protein